MNTRPCLPLANSDWPMEVADLLEGFAGRLNVYRVMAHHPALLRAWAPLRQHLVLDSSLGLERSEVVILRTAWRLQSVYEWSHHVSRARKLGFPSERIAAVAENPAGEDGLIVQAVDMVLDHRRLSARLEQALSTAFGREAVFDLIATVGFYSILGTLLLTYDPPLDPGISGTDFPLPPAPGLARAP